MAVFGPPPGYAAAPPKRRPNSVQPLGSTSELDVTGRANDHRDAKFTVLAESVRHHIKEEENEMLPKAKELDIDFEALGQRMLQRKKQLKEDGIPKDAEHAMVAAAKGKGDSPARATNHKTSVAHSRSSKSGNSHASH